MSAPALPIATTSSISWWKYSVSRRVGHASRRVHHRVAGLRRRTAARGPGRGPSRAHARRSCGRRRRCGAPETARRARDGNVGTGGGGRTSGILTLAVGLARSLRHCRGLRGTGKGLPGWAGRKENSTLSSAASWRTSSSWARRRCRAAPTRPRSRRRCGCAPGPRWHEHGRVGRAIGGGGKAFREQLHEGAHGGHRVVARDRVGIAHLQAVARSQASIRRIRSSASRVRA